MDDVTAGEWVERRLDKPGQIVDCSPDGRIVISRDVEFSGGRNGMGAAGPTGPLRVLDAATGKRLFEWPVEGLRLRTAFSPDSKLVAASPADKDVVLWSTETGREAGRLRAAAGGFGRHVMFSPNGKLVATSATPRDGIVQLWEMPSGKLRHEIALPAVYEMAYSSDSKTIATILRTQAIALWDVETGKERRRWPLPTFATNIAFSPNGATLAAVMGPVIRLWNPVTGEERPLTAQGSTDAIETIAAPGYGTTRTGGEGPSDLEPSGTRGKSPAICPAR